MRNIKKTVKTTIVDIFQLNVENMTVEKIATVEHFGGLGERLAVSRAKKQYGSDVVCKVYDEYATYKMDASVFLQYATLCDENDEDE